METVLVGSLKSLCSDARQIMTVIAMVLFILALTVQVVSRLMKWKRKGFHVLSIVFAVFGVCFLIIYLLVPVIISWLIHPAVVEDPCAIGSGIDYINCTPEGNCTRFLAGGRV